jgi:hypothetical protein
MNRELCLLPLLALLFCGRTSASEYHGWVYNGLTGWSSARDQGLSDDTFGSDSSIGYRWRRIGIEVGHVFFGGFKDSQVVGGTNVDIDSKIDGWNVGLDFNRNLNEKWSMQGRIGVFDWNDDGHVVSGASRVRFGDSGNDWYAGVSIDHKWRKRSGIGFGYTYFKAGDAKIPLWGVHSEYRF